MCPVRHGPEESYEKDERDARIFRRKKISYFSSYLSYLLIPNVMIVIEKKSFIITIIIAVRKRVRVPRRIHGIPPDSKYQKFFNILLSYT